MTGSALGLSPRRLLLLFAFVIVGALVVATLGVGDQRNQPLPDNLEYGEKYKGNPSQDCWRHHRGEGMNDSHVVIPIFPKQIKINEPTTIGVQVQNAWKYDLAELIISLNLSKAPGIQSLQGQQAESTPTEFVPFTGQLTNPVIDPDPPLPPGEDPAKQLLTWVVGQGVTRVSVYLNLTFPEGTHDTVKNKVSALFQPATYTQFGLEPSQTGEDPQRSSIIPDMRPSVTPRPGNYQLTLEFTSGPATEVTYHVDVIVEYEQVGEATVDVVKQLRNPPEENVKPVILVPKVGVTDVIPILIKGTAPGEQILRVEVKALLYYKHQAGGTPNEDRFTRVAEVPIIVGDEFIAGDVKAATAGVNEVDFYLMAGEVTGFSAAFLLVPSLFLGGTYGKASRKFFNNVLGGAKRRVMFHNLVSLGLTLIALIHIVFFLLEVRYSVMMGILWGGLAALSLLILGLTGYYQVPLIQRYGYSWWRSVHLIVGLLVVVFVAWHSVQDGPDFYEGIKQHMPQWLQDFNWEKHDHLK